MTEPDVLSRDIDALKALQRDAWRDLASPSLTTFDRREIRNRIRQSQLELRGYLNMRSERLRFRPQPAEVVSDSLANINFRFFSCLLESESYPLEFEDVGASARQLAQIGHGAADRVAAAAIDLGKVGRLVGIDRLDGQISALLANDL
jgi:hypothetical protein